jgi:hypothetical protein
MCAFVKNLEKAFKHTHTHTHSHSFDLFSHSISKFKAIDSSYFEISKMTMLVSREGMN